jgi:SAM-dependent methyltransferase
MGWASLLQAIEDDDVNSQVQNVLRYSSTPFWSADDWNRRYTPDRSHFEWYLLWSRLKTLVLPYIKLRSAALDLDCGSSSVCNSLPDDGFLRVTGVDAADVIVHHMRTRCERETNVTFQVGDCLSLQVPQQSFDVTFNKETLDCILAGPSGARAAKQALGEVAKVLGPNGIYFLVSHGGREIRRRLVPAGLEVVAVLKEAALGEDVRSWNILVFQREQTAHAALRSIVHE